MLLEKTFLVFFPWSIRGLFEFFYDMVEHLASFKELSIKEIHLRKEKMHLKSFEVRFKVRVIPVSLAHKSSSQKLMGMLSDFDEMYLLKHSDLIAFL